MGSSASLVQHQELIDAYHWSETNLQSTKVKKENTIHLTEDIEQEESDNEDREKLVAHPSEPEIVQQPITEVVSVAAATANEVVMKEPALRKELLSAVLPKFLEELAAFSSNFHGIDISALEDEEKRAAKDAVRHVDGSELANIMQSKEWFSLLIKSVEKLFMCVSIATARQDRPGFPLVYVNGAFEASTGYDRKEIIGTNCKFLQSEKTDPQHVAQLSTALKTGTSTRVTIVNRRKDGSDFYNLLSMSPIYDKNGVYSYVLGVQRDLSHSQPTEEEIKLIDDLTYVLSKIPFSC